MDAFDRRLLEQQVLFFKALSHPTRLWIVRQLRERDYCVCEFVKEIGDDFSTVSKHLAVLKEANIVADHKQGKTVFYHLTHPCIVTVLACVEKTTEE